MLFDGFLFPRGNESPFPEAGKHPFIGIVISVTFQERFQGNKDFGSSLEVEPTRRRPRYQLVLTSSKFLVEIGGSHMGKEEVRGCEDEPIRRGVCTSGLYEEDPLDEGPLGGAHGIVYYGRALGGLYKLKPSGEGGE